MQTPTTVNNSVTSLFSPLSAVPAALEADKTALDAVTYSYAPGSLQSSMTSANSVQTTINDALKNNGFSLCVHPWSYGIAQTGQGRYSQQNDGYLSQLDAYKYIGKKILDKEDKNRLSLHDIFCLSISDNSAISFSNKLNSLNAVFPFAGFEFCQRRISELNNLPKNKLIQKPRALLPDWKEHELNNIHTLNQLTERADNLTSLCQAYADDTSPIDELKAVIDDKVAEAAQVETAWTDLTNTLNDNTGSAFLLSSGSLSQLAEDLEDKVGEVKNFCAVIAIGGPAGSLNILKEIFNL